MKSLLHGMHVVYPLILALLFVGVSWMTPIIHAGSQLFDEVIPHDWRASTHWQAQPPRCEMNWVFYKCSVRLQAIGSPGQSQTLDYLLLETMPTETPAVLEASGDRLTVEFAKSRFAQRVTAMLLWISSVPLALLLTLFGFSFFSLWRQRTKQNPDAFPMLGKIQLDTVFYAIIAYQILGVFGLILVAWWSRWRTKQQRHRDMMAKIDAVYLSNGQPYEGGVHEAFFESKPSVSTPVRAHVPPARKTALPQRTGRGPEFPRR